MPKSNNMFYRRLKMHFLNHKSMIGIALVSILLIILSIWGMASLESYYRNITLATMPLQILMVALNAIIFGYLYMGLMRGGFSKVDKKTIKGNEVNVHFNDVIGIDEAKHSGGHPSYPAPRAMANSIRFTPPISSASARPH